MKGRKVGQIEVTLDEMDTIVQMTKEGATRRSIAEKVDRSIDTVWRYQKKLGMI